MNIGNKRTGNGKGYTESRKRTGQPHSLWPVALCLFLLVGFYVNRHIHIKGLYMDDLYMWSCYGEQSFFEFAFPFRTSTRFRPVYWTLTYLEMLVVRNHPALFVPVNILLNVGIAFLLYYVAKKLQGRELPAWIVGGLYLISHFSYYQIAQALGLLESMSLFMAILILWLLLRFLWEGRRQLFNQSLLWYFLLVLSHERYLALFPLFYVALFFERQKRLYDDGPGRGETDRAEVPSGNVILPDRFRRSGGGYRTPFVSEIIAYLLPIAVLGAIIALRRLFIGAAIPAGTGGTEVKDTFSLGQALLFSLQQVQYIFGMNVGPEYLSGIPWEEVSPHIRRLVHLSWIPLGILVLGYFVLAVHTRAYKKREFQGENLLFLLFIALCIGCSSITIRVEMRWIYVSFAAALLYLSYMMGRIEHWLGEERARLRYRSAEGDRSRRQGNPLPIDRYRNQRAMGQRLHQRAALGLTVLLLAYACLMAPVERYYRSHFSKIYFWENQDRMNSLAEETVEKYGVDGVLGKQVYILENSYGMSDFYGRTFFKVYDPEKTGQGTEIHFLENPEALPADVNRENSLVLREVPEQRGYRDITEEVFG